LILPVLQRHKHVVVVIEIGIGHYSGGRDRIYRLVGWMIDLWNAHHARGVVNPVCRYIAVEVEISGEACAAPAVVDLVLGSVELDVAEGAPISGRQRPIPAGRRSITGDLP